MIPWSVKALSFQSQNFQSSRLLICCVVQKHWFHNPSYPLHAKPVTHNVGVTFPVIEASNSFQYRYPIMGSKRNYFQTFEFGGIPN